MPKFPTIIGGTTDEQETVTIEIYDNGTYKTVITKTEKDGISNYSVERLRSFIKI